MSSDALARNGDASPTPVPPDGPRAALGLPSGDALSLVKDIPVTLSIELGRASMSIKQLLELEQGAVIELDRMVDEPMDVLVNGTLVARGEVVVIDDTFGVRLTEVAGADGTSD